MKTKDILQAATGCALALALATTANAAPILGNIADATIRADGLLQNGTANDLIVGRTFSAAERNGIFVFELPSLGAGVFDSASFSVSLLSTTNIDGTELQNVDLYGLGRRAASTPLGDDYFAGDFGTDDTDATPLQDNFLTSAAAFTGVGNTFSTDASGSAALLGYLNSQYANGAGAGEFVFIRAGLDAVSGTNERFSFTSAEGGIAGVGTSPSIDFEFTSTSTVPEPSSLAVLCCAGVGVFFRRKK